jgi:hypothetical protein
MSDGNRKLEGGEIDPAKLEQLMEIELMQKRAQWQHAKARRSSVRALSFFFLFLVIAGALVAFFVFLSPERIRELRSGNSSSAEPPSASPTASP